MIDAIREVEKLQALQQLTTTLLPSSTVDVILTMMTSVSSAMLLQTAQTKYHHQAHLHETEIFILTQDTILDPNLTIITGTDTGLTGQDHFPAVTDTEATARAIHKEVTPGHIADVHTGPHLTTDTQPLIIINRTQPTGDLHPTEALPHILEIAVGLNYVPCTKLPVWHLLNPPTAFTGQPGKTRIRNINKSPLMTPHPIVTALMNHPVSQMRI